MDAELVRILAGIFGPDSKFESWLAAEGLKSIEDVALLAKTEEEVTRDLIPAAKAASVPTDALMEKIRIKKAWRQCRLSFEGSPATVPFEDDEPLDEKVRKACEGLGIPPSPREVTTQSV